MDAAKLQGSRCRALHPSLIFLIVVAMATAPGKIIFYWLRSGRKIEGELKPFPLETSFKTGTGVYEVDSMQIMTHVDKKKSTHKIREFCDRAPIANLELKRASQFDP